jgi:nitrite reductase/ring-hydroxylating ferredoxin subunit
MSEASSADRPDFRQGVPLDRLADGQMLLGHVAGEPALLVRRVEGLFAVGATCTHYGGPLVEGLLVDDTVRCPWHHACFSLRTGAALRPPALNGLPRWRVEQRDGMVFVCEPLPAAVPPTLAAARLPASIVIIGGGASGNTAAETLRQEGYTSPITLLILLCHFPLAVADNYPI